MPGGWVDRESMATGPTGRPLCRWCNLEVPRGRSTFCSGWCVEEWKLRSDRVALRQRVFERDHGICAQCGLDCIAHFLYLRKLRGAGRTRAESDWNRGSRKSLWDADHIVAVAEGGGECDVSNMRTLCLKCHRKVTAELRARLGSQKVSLPSKSPIG